MLDIYLLFTGAGDCEEKAFPVPVTVRGLDKRTASIDEINGEVEEAIQTSQTEIKVMASICK